MILVVMILVVVLAIPTGLLLDKKDTCYGLSVILGIVSAAFLFAIAICLCVIMHANITANACIAANKEIYKSLTYQLENGIYDNENGIGAKELYAQIRDWNVNLAKMKAYQRDFWVGIFYPNIFDDFDFIELK